jgi:GNAT superfamily N-acetyltransferase
MKPIIRELVEADIPTVAPMLHEMWIQHANSGQLLDTKYIENYDVAAYCKRSIDDPKQQSFVAEVDGQVVGVAGLQIEDNLPGMYGVDRMAYFDDLVIKPEFRRRGIAGQLIERRVEYAREQGIKVCYSKIYSFNKPPQELMKKHGFEDVYHFYYRFLK